MARRTRLGAALDGAEEPTAAATEHEDPNDSEQDTAPKTRKPAKTPRSSKKTASPRKKSTSGRSGTTRTRKQPAAKTEPARPEPEVLGIDTRSAKRQSIYLHPDDHRALAQGRIDDGADANARIRAMIAVWRTNPRYRTLVDRLARTAPRGGGH